MTGATFNKTIIIFIVFLIYKYLNMETKHLENISTMRIR